MIWTAEELTKWSDRTLTKCGEWKPARPINHKFESRRSRIKAAFLVLAGRCDALDWEEEAER